MLPAGLTGRPGGLQGWVLSNERPQSAASASSRLKPLAKVAVSTVLKSSVCGNVVAMGKVVRYLH